MANVCLWAFKVPAAEQTILLETTRKAQTFLIIILHLMCINDFQIQIKLKKYYITKYFKIIC